MAQQLATPAENRTGRLKGFSQHWFKFAQRLSQALLVPIAILPAAGVMKGLASTPTGILSPSLNELFATTGNLIFTMMPLLFAIAIAIGFCRDPGIAAFSAAFGFGVFSSTLSLLASQNPVHTSVWLGVETIDTGIAGGMLLGVMTCLAMAMSRHLRLPAIFSFFEGRRSAPLLMLPLAVLLAYLLALIWPPLAHYIEVFSNWAVYQKPQLAFAIYGTVERLLLPLGLHHIWNAPFYLELGQYYQDGEWLRGEVARYLAGDPQAGNLAGGYLIKMWGLPAAALAIWRCADKSECNRVAGIMLSAAATSWLTGVTEPIEFAFLFVAPLLYLVHALLTGLAYTVCIWLDIHYGLVFSNGLLDFALLWHQSANAGWFLILGPLTAVIYYLIFRASIMAFNLKTPGRLEPETASGGNLLAMIGALGGAANIRNLSACMTRLRLSVERPELVDKSRLLGLGAKGVIVVGQGVQVVFGTKAETLRGLLQKYLDSRQASRR
ncbi:PTS transporter subunit EIIC [Shewanella algae]|uniref:PTS transporter subunit EIIC n=1 Tax=Shewanella algae TaxID=38313 RepID=UPI001AAD3E37|nr:PTS transporter subunit EIIC [Shewanella algae]MBO2612907.1 PTS transporter subunit EIIC [Shewanella algae]